MIKENKSSDWYFNEISCYFESEAEILDIISKIKKKRLVKVFFSEIYKIRNSPFSLKNNFGYYNTLYHLNLEIRKISIIKSSEDYRNHKYYFEFNDRENFASVYYLELNFLDKLFFQDIQDSDFK